MPPESSASSAKSRKGKIARTILLGIVVASLGACVLARTLDPTSTVPPDTQSVATEKPTDLYQNPQIITIENYDDDCMEPFITGDGKYLLFNNSNSFFADTHIHLCERIDELRFKHLGLLPGSISKSKDMAPAMDANNHMFFTSTRSFEQDGNSIYLGNFVDAKAKDISTEGSSKPESNFELKNVALAQGEISPHKPAEINMDCDISKDGFNLILSRAHFANPLLPPDSSDFVIAEKTDGKFAVKPQTQVIFQRVNTSALEYAPCLSVDQLELFFTRTSLRDGKPYSRIMVSTRKDRSSPFEEPHVLNAFDGFIEAPTVTDDMHEMFFHKKVGEKFRIIRAERKP